MSALQTLSRQEIKDLLLSYPGFKSLLESCGGGIQDVIENFLNGRYQDFQRQLSKIAEGLRFDLYFGSKLQHVMSEIRRKALIQYVAPYKVIDIREIAKAFDMTVDAVEKELAELIGAKKIQAKIDSFGKLLYSHKDNETLLSYREAVQVGAKFIQETETALLRV